MAVFNGSAGKNQAFTGSTAADTFNFAVADLTSGDTLAGGTGGAIDVLAFTTAGTVTAAMLAHVSQIEQIALFNGANNLTLTDALAGSANGGVLRIIGGAGNDTVNGSAVTTPANRLDIALGSGNDSVTGGAGSDFFRVAVAELTANDTIAGGAGALDNLVFTAPGTIAAAAFLRVTGIEQITLANGTNTLVLNNAMAVSASGSMLAVLGGSGNDTILGTAVVNGAARLSLTLGGGNDSVVGGAGSDFFNVAAAELNSADTIAGGNGTVDTLNIITSGTLSAATFANVSGVEQLKLANGTNDVTLTNALAGSSSTAVLTVLGGTGNDTLDGAAVTTATNRVDFTLGTGNDSFTGGAGSDFARVNIADFNAADTIIGGTGQLDTLFLTTAGTVAAAAFAHVSGIEQVRLSNGANAIALSNELVAAASGTMLKVLGGAGNDTIDGGAVTVAGNRLDIYLGGGNDSATGGAGSDYFQVALAEFGAGDTITGGAGNVDSLNFSTAGTITAAVFANTSGIEQIKLASGTNMLTLDDTLIASASGTSIRVLGGAGNDTVDASAVVGMANKIDVASGGGIDMLTGGMGADIFRFAASELNASDTVAGGGGTAQDLLLLSTAGSFAAALGHVTGIERVSLAAGANLLVLSNGLVGSAANATLTVTGNTGDDTVDAGAVSAGSVIVRSGDGADMLRLAPSATSFSGDLGTGNDTLDMLAGFVPGTISGGAGTDTLSVRFSHAGSGTMGAGLTQFERVDLRGEGASVSFATNNIAGLVVTAANAGVSYAIALGWYGQTATGNDQADTLTGGDGNDTLDGAAGPDAIAGGGGDDIAVYDMYDSAIQGGAGTDRLMVRDAATFDLNDGVQDQSPFDIETVYGIEDLDASSSVIAVNFTGRDDLISVLIGGSGDDTITAGDAGAAITGGTGADTLLGGDGADAFYLSVGDAAAGETIDGLAGSEDSIHTTGDVDLTAATIGNIETLHISAGATVAISNAGIEWVIGLYGADPAPDTAETLVVKIASGGTAVLGGLFVYDFSPSDAVLIEGAGGAETIYAALTGQQTVKAGAGNDTIYTRADYAGAVFEGEAGNDVLQHQDAATTLDGGGDADTLLGDATHATNALTLDLSIEDGDQTSGDAATVVGFESVDWSAMSGALDATGSSGANRLSGGSGDDTLRGGEGADDLTGGAGADRFVYTAASDAPDTIHDFLPGTDLLVFDGPAFDFNGAAFDTLVDDADGTVDIASADLIRLTGTTLDDAGDVAAYLQGNGTGSAGEGVFVLGSDSAGDTVLYYAPDASGAEPGALYVAVLENTAPGVIGVADFLVG